MMSELMVQPVWLNGKNGENKTEKNQLLLREKTNGRTSFKRDSYLA